jgi:hypothetical protein
MTLIAAFTISKSTVKPGYAGPQFNLNLIYDSAEGVKKDDKEAG